MPKTIQQRTGRAEIKRQGHTEASDGAFGTNSRARAKYGSGKSKNQNR